MKTYSNDGNQYKARGERLSQIDSETGEIIRSVSRKQVREVFRGARFRIDGLYPGKPVSTWRDLWLARGNKSVLQIGCQEFSGSNLDVIRRWAFKRKKKKA